MISLFTEPIEHDCDSLKKQWKELEQMKIEIITSRQN